MPALVRESDDVAALEQALVENVHRADLNALEEAAAYQQLIEDFSLTHEAVATRVGRSRTAVTNTLRLLQLPPSVQRLVRDGALSMGHARALLGTPDRGLQERLAAQSVREGWSVRAVEEAVRGPGAAAGSGTTKVDAASATKPLRPPGLAELEGLLGDHLETRVAISMGAKRGKITVEFSDLEDLERIYKTIAG
jgi:ParB family chromosome partitioning protein